MTKVPTLTLLPSHSITHKIYVYTYILTHTQIQVFIYTNTYNDENNNNEEIDMRGFFCTSPSPKLHTIVLYKITHYILYKNTLKQESCKFFNGNCENNKPVNENNKPDTNVLHLFPCAMPVN